MSLHPWYIRFNPLKDTPQHKYIWLKLSGLSIELWTRRAFMDIGKTISSFIYVDPKCIGAMDKQVS